MATANAKRTDDISDEEAINAISRFVAATVLFVVAVVCQGAALMLMWRWFFVPFGLMEIGLAHAIGLSATVRFGVIGMGKPSKKPLVRMCLEYLIFTGIATLMAWFVSLFM